MPLSREISSAILDELARGARVILDGGDPTWTWHHGMSVETREHFDAFLVEFDDPLAWVPMRTEARYLHRVGRMAYLEKCRIDGTTPEVDPIIDLMVRPS